MRRAGRLKASNPISIMKRTKPRIEIVRRNLLIIAVGLLGVGIATFIVLAKAWLHTDFSMPAKVTPEMYRSSEEALSTGVFVVFPILGVFLLTAAGGIWVQIRRLRKSESE